MSNNPAPTMKQIEREEAASKAEDTLALYQAAKSEMSGFLLTLSRGDGFKKFDTLVEAMLNNLEYSIFGAMPLCRTVNMSHSVAAICQAAKDYENVDELIDDHFAEYIAQAKEIRG